MKKTFQIYFLFLFVFCNLKAQTPWIVDASFGNNGATRVNFGPGYNDFPNDMLLSDNKILVGGITTSTDGYFVSITQLMENGQVDTSNFGIDGKVLVHFVARDHANVLELKNDGKILAAGSEATSNAASAITPSLYRFNPDGTIDTTFGNGGRAVYRFSGNSSGELYGIKVLEDGRILVGGASTGTKGFGAMRFLPNGELDTNFGTGGLARINYGLGYHSVACLFLADTAILMASVGISPTNIVLAMMDSSGNPYTTFGNNGIVETDIIGKYNFSGGETLLLTDDNKILLSATTPNSSPTMFSVFRFFLDGSIDSTFGTNGRTDIQFTSNDVCYDMKLDADGKILLVGQGEGQSGLIRLNSDGTPDTTFAPEGKFSLDLSIGSGTNYLTNCLPLSNGDILATGYDFTSNSGDYVIAKLTQNPTGLYESDAELPSDFSLSQNYPNPFNPSTKISYTIQASPNPSDLSRGGKASTEGGALVQLKVYDVLGNEVATLVDEYKPAGKYEIEFDASKLSSGISAKGGYASGVYFYRLQAGLFTNTKKLLFMK